MDHLEKDRYGVSWGQEKQRPKDQENQRPKITKRYSSFHLGGITYSPNDTVYLLSSDGPPHIGKILSMYEEATKEKCMLVRWFCRPCELPLRAAGVNWKEDCKEIFMMGGIGSKNVVNPASTIGKCRVVCTSPLDWNSPPPSNEWIAGADHTFSYAFDSRKLQVISLDTLVKEFGERYVTGIGVQNQEKKSRGGNPRKAVQPVIERTAGVVDSDRRVPQLVGRASDGSSGASKSNSGNLKKALEPDIKPTAGVLDSDRRRPQPVGSASASPMLVRKSNQGSVKKALEMSDLIAEARKKKLRCDSSAPKSEPGVSGRPKLSDSLPDGLGESRKNVSLVDKPDVTGTVIGIKLVERELKGKQVEEPRGAPTRPVSSIYHATPKVAGEELNREQKLDSEVAPSRLVPNFFNMPFHKTLEMAIKKGRAVLLQNLDPWFSSSEIEGMLTELLRVSCDARMLPPKDFSSYTSGEALVLFRTQLEAEEAYAKFTENVLIWSEDQRPVVASFASKQGHESNHFHGFLNLAKFNPTHTEFLQGARGATSQCSQPNTVVFEMGMQWRLLQEKHSEAWNLAGKSTSKDAIKLPFLLIPMDHISYAHYHPLYVCPRIHRFSTVSTQKY